MSSRYFITLKPMEPFFFGGEYTFGSDDSRTQKEESRYFAKSELFPQQSAVLGMLRKAILNKKNIMTLHKKGEWVDSAKKAYQSTNKNYLEAVRLTGKGRFSYETDFDTGVIESISPLFVYANQKNYFIDAADRDYMPRETTGTMLIKNKPQKIIVFDGYDAKKYVPPAFCSQTDKLPFDKLYKSLQTVGIKKARQGKTEEDAFFMKESYMLRDNASFAFILQSSEDMLFLDRTLVALGADQSSFMLSVQEYDKSFETLTDDCFITKTGFDRLVLLSETLLDQEAYDLCTFVMGERKTMRHLTADNQNSKKFKKSKRYYLFQRGTVLYTNALEKLKEALSKTHLQKAGINHFHTAKGASHVQQ